MRRDWRFKCEAIPNAAKANQSFVSFRSEWH